MSVEAMWTVRFGQIGAKDRDLNGGVAVLESGRLFGGDSTYAYVGDYALNGEHITGNLTIIRHEFSPGQPSIYGTNEDRFQLRFEGRRISEDRFEGRLRRQNYPDAKLVLSRLAELP